MSLGSPEFYKMKVEVKVTPGGVNAKMHGWILRKDKWRVQFPAASGAMDVNMKILLNGGT